MDDSLSLSRTRTGIINLCILLKELASYKQGCLQIPQVHSAGHCECMFKAAHDFSFLCTYNKDILANLVFIPFVPIDLIAL